MCCRQRGRQGQQTRSLSPVPVMNLEYDSVGVAIYILRECRCKTVAFENIGIIISSLSYIFHWSNASCALKINYSKTSQNGQCY